MRVVRITVSLRWTVDTPRGPTFLEYPLSHPSRLSLQKLFCHHIFHHWPLNHLDPSQLRYDAPKTAKV